MRPLLRSGLLSLALALGLAAPAAAQDSRWLHAALGAFMAAQGADLASSMWCRGAATCQEANPILRPMQDAPVGFGATKMTIAAGQTWLLLRMHNEHPKLALILTLSGTALYTGLALRNATTGRRAPPDRP